MAAGQASHGAGEFCQTCLARWLDTLAVLDAVRTDDLAGARTVLAAGETAEVAMLLAHVLCKELGSDEWTGDPLEYLITAHRNRFVRLEAEGKIAAG